MQQKKVYQTVIDEVIDRVRDAFLDDGYDEQLLQELKQVGLFNNPFFAYKYLLLSLISLIFGVRKIDYSKIIFIFLRK